VPGDTGKITDQCTAAYTDDKGTQQLISYRIISLMFDNFTRHINRGLELACRGAGEANAGRLATNTIKSDSVAASALRAMDPFFGHNVSPLYN
jgi:hypothetical protein